MRIIFSRKGFDSSAGGKPSPILPDGRMVSLPIPDKQSSIHYGDIRWQEYNLSSLVYDLTDGRIPASHFAHLDPDINRENLSRHPEWRPIFGQTGAAQGHLRNNDVQAGDVFLFFGLFRNVLNNAGKLAWDKQSSLCHVLWGWLQIEKVQKIDDCNLEEYEWAKYHPHFCRNPDRNNTLYIARKYLTFPGVTIEGVEGAGVFQEFSERLVLTAPAATSPSQWKLPQWFYPRNGKSPLTYHSNLTRWQRFENGTRLDAVARGQEFIFDTTNFPEAMEWLKGLLVNNDIFR
ncbi:MAG: hypothetical protein O7E52_21285 [Candidatus Poribacteria bacterium]|nr:hypothetical protein [Candidatus Poribacteria bacterium]